MIVLSTVWGLFVKPQKAKKYQMIGVSYNHAQTLCISLLLSICQNAYKHRLVNILFEVDHNMSQTSFEF